MTVLDRAQHLSELALDRLRFDPPESDPEFRAEAMAHLEACEACRRAHDRMAEEDASFGELDPPRVRAPSSKPPGAMRRPVPRRARIAAVLALAAAVVALLVRSLPEAPSSGSTTSDLAQRPADDPDGHLDVAPFWALAGTRWPARSGDVRRAGAVLGFRPIASEGGFLLVAEFREDGGSAPVWPESGDAAAVSDDDPPVALPPTASSQTFVAVLCRKAFRFEDLRFVTGPGETIGVEVDGQAAGCAIRVVSVQAPRALPTAPTAEAPPIGPALTPGPEPTSPGPPRDPGPAADKAGPCDRELGTCIASGLSIRECLTARRECGARVAVRPRTGPVAAGDDECTQMEKLCRRAGGDALSCSLAAAACQTMQTREKPPSTSTARTADTVARGSAEPTRRVACEAFLAGCVATSTTVEQLRRCQRGFFACAGSSPGASP
jgi:hypothetical protein